MQVLGNQKEFCSSHLHLQHHLNPKISLPSQFNCLANTNNFFSQKKKLMNVKIKISSPCDFHFEDFKQNHPKPKPSQQSDIFKNCKSERQCKIVPFSSVLNIKQQPKISQPPKAITKLQDRQVVNQQKRDEPYRSSKQQTKKCIQKMIESKLNHMIENKRKCASFKTPAGPGQNINRSQKRKQSYHVQQTKKQIHYKQEQKKQKQDKKQMVLNKHKGSLSFIIRKKINSNATQSQRNYQKIGKNEGISSFEKEQLIKSQNSKYSYESNSYNTKKMSQNITLSKYAYKPMDNQLKNLRQRYPNNKQTPIKAHPIKGTKCLKVRVNKVLKAQEQLFNKDYFSKQNANYKNEEEKLKQTQNKVQFKPPLDIVERTQTPAQLAEKLITIQQILRNNRKKASIELQEQSSHQGQDSIRKSNLINTEQSKKKDSARSIIQVKKQQNKTQQARDQVKWKSYKQTQKEPNPTNRKRISSIRAIKNYYKKLDTQHYTQEKSSFMNSEKESKQGMAIKKKDKESAACLTHKIKWGHSSKKKLNSDRIPSDAFKFADQSSNNTNKGQIKQQKFIEKHKLPEKQYPHIKVMIQTKQLTSPKTKKPFKKVQFLEERFLKAKNQKISKAEKNLQKIFAHTINSKEFIESEFIPFHAGSKSLIIFEDPGISMIINNNSIHSPNQPIGFNDKSSQELGNAEIHEVKPLVMVKKTDYDKIEEKFEEEEHPLESLQELYFQLKSRKDINPKAKNVQIRIQSFEELCQG